MSKDNVSIVQKIYAEFGAGNVEGILAMLSDDIEWSEPPSGVAPFAGTRRGRTQVAEFFQSLFAMCEPVQFEPGEFIGHGNKVIVFGSYQFRAKPTGKTWDSDWVMTWTLAGDKVTRFKIYKDSAAEVAAFQA